MQETTFNQLYEQGVNRRHSAVKRLLSGQSYTWRVHEPYPEPYLEKIMEHLPYPIEIAITAITVEQAQMSPGYRPFEASKITFCLRVEDMKLQSGFTVAAHAKPIGLTEWLDQAVVPTLTNNLNMLRAYVTAT